MARNEPSIDHLLGEARWLRRLALALAGDAHRAEDAVQHTLIAAWRSLADGRSLGRGWLARVLRNFLLQERRGDARRRAREDAHGGAEGPRTPREVAERVELQRRLAEAIQSLREPYRSTIVYRHFDGLAPREIADRTGAPIRTVNTRLYRAHALLRERLESEYGETTLPALFALALGGANSAATTLVLSTKAKLAFLVVVVGATFAGWVRWSPPSQAAAFDVQLPEVVEPIPAAIEPASLPVAPARGHVAPPPPHRSSVPVAAQQRPAELRIEVLLAGTRAPVPDARVRLAERSANPRYSLRSRTGRDGTAALAPPVGVPLIVTVEADSESFAFPVDVGEALVAPLEAGERSDVQVFLRHGFDASLVVHVVDATHGTPLPLARAAPRLGAPVEPILDADARFTVAFSTWRRGEVEVTCDGYGPAIVDVGRAFARPSPFVVPLERAATLVVRLPDAPPGAVLRARANGDDLLRPSGGEAEGDGPIVLCAPDAASLATLDGLAPNVALEVDVLSATGEVLWVAGEPVRLEPGEVRRVEWWLGSGAELTGRVRDPDGTALADVELRVQRLSGGAREPTYFRSSDRERPGRVARSSADGSYSVPGLAPGPWWVGPAASDDDPRELAPWATVVEVPAGGARVLHDVHVFPGSFVSGRVRDAQGAPVAGTAVFAFPDDATGSAHAVSGADGSFRIGPLVPREHWLSVHRSGTFDRSSRRRVAAPADGVSIVVGLGLEVRGRIVDESGEPVESHVHLMFENGGSLGMQTGGGGVGRFRFGGLDAGAYVLTAETDDDRVAFEPVTLAEGEGRDVELRLQRGARLRIGWAGDPEGARCAVFMGGVRVADGKFSADGPRMEIVAPGPALVQAYRGGRILEERTVLLEPGRMVELELGSR